MDLMDNDSPYNPGVSENPNSSSTLNHLLSTPSPFPPPSSHFLHQPSYGMQYAGPRSDMFPHQHVQQGFGGPVDKKHPDWMSTAQGFPPFSQLPVPGMVPGVPVAPEVDYGAAAAGTAPARSKSKKKSRAKHPASPGSGGGGSTTSPRSSAHQLQQQVIEQQQMQQMQPHPPASSSKSKGRKNQQQPPPPQFSMPEMGGPSEDSSGESTFAPGRYYQRPSGQEMGQPRPFPVASPNMGPLGLQLGQPMQMGEQQPPPGLYGDMAPGLGMKQNPFFGLDAGRSGPPSHGSTFPGSSGAGVEASGQSSGIGYQPYAFKPTMPFYQQEAAGTAPWQQQQQQMMSTDRGAGLPSQSSLDSQLEEKTSSSAGGSQSSYPNPQTQDEFFFGGDSGSASAPAKNNSNRSSPGKFSGAASQPPRGDPDSAPAAGQDSPSPWTKAAPSDSSPHSSNPVSHTAKSSADKLGLLYEMGDEPDRRVFIDHLIKFAEEHATPLISIPVVSKVSLDLYKFYNCVKLRGGYVEVQKTKGWKEIAGILGISAPNPNTAYTLKKHYNKWLLPYEARFDRGGVDPETLVQTAESLPTKSPSRSGSSKSKRSRSHVNAVQEQLASGPGSEGVAQGVPLQPPYAAQQRFSPDRNAPSFGLSGPAATSYPHEMQQQQQPGPPQPGGGMPPMSGGPQGYGPGPGQEMMQQQQHPSSMYWGGPPPGQAPHRVMHEGYNQENARRRTEEDTMQRLSGGNTRGLSAFPPSAGTQHHANAYGNYANTDYQANPAVGSAPGLPGMGMTPDVDHGRRYGEGPPMGAPQAYPMTVPSAQPLTERNLYHQQPQQPFNAGGTALVGSKMMQSRDGRHLANPPDVHHGHRPSGAPSHSHLTQQPPIVPPTHEIVFPPNSIEAADVMLRNRPKLSAKEVGAVDVWKLHMRMKSGLLAESGWAFEMLNIYSSEEQFGNQFNLANLPVGFLDTIIEWFGVAMSRLLGDHSYHLSQQTGEPPADGGENVEGIQACSHVESQGTTRSPQRDDVRCCEECSHLQTYSLFENGFAPQQDPTPWINPERRIASASSDVIASSLHEAPFLNLMTERDEEISRKCIAISTCIRNLSAISGNEVVLGKSQRLLCLLGRFITFNHHHVVPEEETPAGLRKGENEVEGEGEEGACESTMTSGPWWQDVVEHVRENLLVTLANIAGHMDLSESDEAVCRPILEGLIHWTVCSSSVAQDTLPTVVVQHLAGELSAKCLAMEALSKLTVNDSNIDLLTAAPSGTELSQFIHQLIQQLPSGQNVPSISFLTSVSTCQLIREFAIVILCSLVVSDERVCLIVAEHPFGVDYLTMLLEEFDRIAKSKGDSNFDLSGAGVNVMVLRKTVEILLAIAELSGVARGLLSKYQMRYWNLVTDFRLADSTALSGLTKILYLLSASETGPVVDPIA